MTQLLSRRNTLTLAAATSLGATIPQLGYAKNTTVRYAMQRVPEDFVYRAKDWATPFGIKVAESVSPSAVQSMQALLSGRADLADSGSGPVLSALSHARGELTVVSATHSGGQRHEVMVRPGSPYTSLSSLKGKRIAIPVGSGAYVVFELYLAKHGLKNSDFLLVNMKPSDMGAALASRQVDAAIAWEPTPSILVTKGIAKVIQNFRKTSPDPALLVARKDFVTKHKDVLVRFLASMIDMYAFIRKNPEGAGKLAAKVANQSGASVSPAAFTRAFHHMTFDMHITHADIVALDEVGRFMRKQHKIAAVPDFHKVIDQSPLQHAFAMAKAKH